MRVLFSLIVAIIMIVVGGMFMLQGLGFMAGSAMTGQIFWAVIGLILVAVGAVIAFTMLTKKTPDKPARFQTLKFQYED